MASKKGKIDEIGHTSTGDSRRALICASSYPVSMIGAIEPFCDRRNEAIS